MNLKKDIKRIKVRLYGESFKIHILDMNTIDLKDFISVSQRLNEPLEASLLDASFYRILNRENKHSIEDLVDQTFGGLINTAKSKIEIWRGRKCIQKLTLNELFYPRTLFPLFNTTREDSNFQLPNSIFLIEKEVGLIDEYVFECYDFDINLLKFSISDVHYEKHHFQLLASISYSSKRLESKKSDTLVTYRHCINHLNEK